MNLFRVLKTTVMTGMNVTCSVKKQAAEKHADVIFIGDSITHFWESTHGGPVWEKYFKGKNVLNLGYGYDRTSNVLWRLDHGEFAGQTPKLVVLNIGTNNFAKTDAYPGDVPEDVADGIEEILKKLHSFSPDTHIVVMAVFPRLWESHHDNINELNAILKKRLAGRNRISFLDLTADFYEKTGQRNEEYFRDDAHLTCSGYEVWMNGLRPYLAEFGGI